MGRAAFAEQHRKITLDSDDVGGAVLSLELEKDRAKRRGSDMAKRLLQDLERKLKEPDKKRPPKSK